MDTNHANRMLYILYTKKKKKKLVYIVYTNHENNLKSHNGICYVHYVRPSCRLPNIQPPRNPAGFRHITS